MIYIFNIIIASFSTFLILFLYYKKDFFIKKYFQNHLIIFILKLLFISMFIYFFIFNFSIYNYKIFIISGYFNFTFFHILEGIISQNIFFKHDTKK